MPRIGARTDATELRQCIRDLIAISTSSAIQKVYDPHQIADDVAAALRTMLDLELAFISMREKSDAPPIEITHASDTQSHDVLSEIAMAMLNAKLADEIKSLETDEARSDNERLRYTSVPIGVEGYDFIVAASREPDFPTERQRLLMRVAADAVAVALQGWRAELDSNRFRFLAENSADFVGYTDLKGHLQYLNPAGCEIVGLSDIEEACQHPILDYVMREERRRVIDEISPRIVLNGRWRGELLFRNFKTGVAAPFSVDCFRIDDPRDGRLTNIAIVGRDLRPIKSVEHSLRKLNESLETRVLERTTALADANCKLLEEIGARERADTRLQQLQSERFGSVRVSAAGQTGAALVHELNQPLAASANYINSARRLISEDTFLISRDAARAAMEDAFAEIVRTQSIIRQLREFIARGTTERRWVSLKELVENAGGLALTGQKCAHVKLAFAFASEFTIVHVDRIQIQQVLTNLMRNAFEAMADTPKGELKITTAMQGEDRVVVTISDTGPGIAPEVADNLFEPFTSTKRDGMGIGLSISKSIVEAHGGALVCDSRSGSGVTFWFSLRAASGARANAD